MTATIIIISIVAIAVVVADVIVRLLITPHQRDRWIEELMGSMIEPATTWSSNGPGSLPAECLPEAALLDSLLRHFQQSITSRNVLKTVANEGGGLTENQIVHAVNQLQEQKGRRRLPHAVIHRVVLNLMSANFLALRRGALHLTSAGKVVHERLQIRQAA